MTWLTYCLSIFLHLNLYFGIGVGVVENLNLSSSEVSAGTLHEIKSNMQMLCWIKNHDWVSDWMAFVAINNGRHCRSCLQCAFRDTSSIDESWCARDNHVTLTLAAPSSWGGVRNSWPCSCRNHWVLYTMREAAPNRRMRPNNSTIGGICYGHTHEWMMGAHIHCPLTSITITSTAVTTTVHVLTVADSCITTLRRKSNRSHKLDATPFSPSCSWCKSCYTAVCQYSSSHL
jgi:hypothetical protein